jgi:hypothetical protein
MSLADTSGAIGAVTKALISRISFRAGIPNVVAGRPDQNAEGDCLNLFLYEISYDPTLKNLSLDEGQKAPVWMVLKYILTAFAAGKSDSSNAHINLGKAIQAIHQQDLLKLDGLDIDVLKALGSNPEELNVTFDEAPVELLSKVTQGSDESLRISIAFQVRPVMIASPDAPGYSLLVGVDYTKSPTALTPKPVELDIIPSLGAFIAEVVPGGFEIGEEVSVKGTDLHLSNLSVRLGSVDFPVTMQKPDELRFLVDGGLINAAGMSAGSHSLTVVQTLASGKKRKSNMVVANLVPTLTKAEIVLRTNPPPPTFATLELTGLLLGDNADDAILALYRDGRVFRMFDVFTSSPVPQKVRQLVIELNDDVEATEDIPAGDYLTILRVNGQQARQSPKITIAP